MTSHIEASNEWWTRVTHHVESHLREEGHLLDAYQDTAARTDDPAIGFLLGLILEDEHRHHDTFTAIAKSLVGEGDGLPDAPEPSAVTVADLLEPTVAFLDAERDDLRQVKAAWSMAQSSIRSRRSTIR